MLEDLIRQQQLENLTGMALHRNTMLAEDFGKRKADWIENAPIRAALKLPPDLKPIPAKKQIVQMTPDGPELRFTDLFVCDPTVELPPPAPPKPENVFDLGAPHGGGLYQVGSNDTMAAGSTPEKDGKKYLKHVVNYGGWMSQWYSEVL